MITKIIMCGIVTIITDVDEKRLNDEKYIEELKCNLRMNAKGKIDAGDYHIAILASDLFELDPVIKV